MKKPKLKVGDRVALTKPCIEWLIAWIMQGYTFDGKYQKGKYDSELLALFTAREFDLPLHGTVSKLGFDTPTSPTVYVECSNMYGTYSAWHECKDVALFRDKGKRAGTKGRKK